MPGRGNAGSMGASLMKAGRHTCTGLIYKLLVLLSYALRSLAIPDQSNEEK